ncbi:MAG: hypothetical protein ACO1QB_00185 [Verrucomicrobiales bacterium]
MIEQFLSSLKFSGRTWFNYAQLVRTLFLYTQSKGYYPKGRNPMGEIEIEHDADDEIEIFTPGEMITLLNAARAEIVPFLVMGAFAGLRHAEITRLDWAQEIGRVKTSHWVLMGVTLFLPIV